MTLADGQTDGSGASDPDAKVLDPNGYHCAFEQKTSGSPTVQQATFKVITCTGADPFEPGPDVLIKCALPGCFPINSSCTRLASSSTWRTDLGSATLPEMTVPTVDTSTWPVVVITHGVQASLEDVPIFLRVLEPIYSRGAGFATTLSAYNNETN